MGSKEYLSFTRRERLGILLLLIILFAMITASNLTSRPEVASAQDAELAIRLLDSGRNAHRRDTYVRPTAPEHGTRATREAARGSDNIKRRNAGAKARDGNKSNFKQGGSWHRDDGKAAAARRVEVVDINTADTTDFIRLPGIGSILAARIVLFRERLGGFHDVSQIGEVYGIRDSVFQRIRPNLSCRDPVIRQIALNEAAEDELRRHPYIRWQLAAALVAYRQQHGKFKSVNDVAGIHLVDSIALARMIPYLSLN